MIKHVQSKATTKERGNRYDGNCTLLDVQHLIVGKSATLKHEMLYLLRGVFIEGK